VEGVKAELLVLKIFDVAPQHWQMLVWRELDANEQWSVGDYNTFWDAL